jgi:hypothetical protein
MAAKRHWKEVPDPHDYPAAADYLSLVMPRNKAADLANALRATPIVHRKAKDLLRASNLPELPPDNVHVAKDLSKIKKGGLLSPVLLVRGRRGAGVPLTIADGYHRICASYHIDEDAVIPCRIVDEA